jgi:hypothetical protein
METVGREYCSGRLSGRKKAGVLWRRRLELKVRICAVKPETATAANEFDIIMTGGNNYL